MACMEEEQIKMRNPSPPYKDPKSLIGPDGR